MKYWLAVIVLSAFSSLAMGQEPIKPLPRSVVYDHAKAALGRQLFSDTLLSSDKTVACATCHSFNYGGADPRPVSIGVGGKTGSVQSPTVYNARYNFKQFWNGRAASLMEQASGPIHNPVEMGMESTTIAQRLNADPDYVKAFAAVYGEGEITYEQAIEAIVEFEKALVTPDSPFDRFLRGETTLSPLELEGYQRFKAYGCITCHNGINIGGNSFQKMGLFVPYEHDEAAPDLHAVTNQRRHMNVYKVPTLRNIALTAPYFHDASSKTLTDAVQKMSYHNLGVELSDKDVRAIVAFLKTLTGERPEVLR
ncbi:MULTISPECIES: cytochrome-c peroxidase [Sulfurimonas]|uniref:Cytochrome-c peroxidase n=1 Tax=Sulfurimonas diazotrophicus TaxID=3131939 RepID=A0ABZ3H8Y9_9BACT